MVCPANQAGQLYRINRRFTCEEKATKLVKVELKKDNVREYVVQARSMLVWRDTCKTYQSFVGTKVKEQSTEVVKWSSRSRYQSHIDRNSCEDIEGRTYLGRSGGRNENCPFSFLKHRKTETLRCEHKTGKVIGAHGSLLRSDLGDVSHCHFQDSYCLTNRGVAITWSPDPMERKKYVPVGNFNGTMVSQYNLLIDELGIGLNLQEMESIGEGTYTKTKTSKSR